MESHAHLEPPNKRRKLYADEQTMKELDDEPFKLSTKYFTATGQSTPLLDQYKSKKQKKQSPDKPANLIESFFPKLKSPETKKSSSEPSPVINNANIPTTPEKTKPEEPLVQEKTVQHEAKTLSPFGPTRSNLSDEKPKEKSPFGTTRSEVQPTPSAFSSNRSTISKPEGISAFASMKSGLKSLNDTKNMPTFKNSAKATGPKKKSQAFKVQNTYVCQISRLKLILDQN